MSGAESSPSSGLRVLRKVLRYLHVLFICALATSSIVVLLLPMIIRRVQPRLNFYRLGPVTSIESSLMLGPDWFSVSYLPSEYAAIGGTIYGGEYEELGDDSYYRSKPTAVLFLCWRTAYQGPPIQRNHYRNGFGLGYDCPNKLSNAIPLSRRSTRHLWECQEFEKRVAARYEQQYGIKTVPVRLDLQARPWFFSAVLALYPTIAFLKGPANRAVRRWRRKRRGQCVTCGYSLEGNVSGVCPECGRARNAYRDMEDAGQISLGE